MDREKILTERASFARDIEYLTTMTEDADINDSVISASNKGNLELEDVNDPELLSIIDQIPGVNDQEDAEIKRIIDANGDLDIDDVMGIKNSEDIDTAIDVADNQLNNEEEE